MNCSTRTTRTNLSHLVEQAAEFYGSAPALTYKEDTCTYSELWARVCGFASALIGLGVNRDDRVAVFLEKRIETVVAIFGAAAAGAVSVPVNSLLRPQQVAYILGDCSVRVLVTSPERLAQLEKDDANTASVDHVILIDEGLKTAARPAKTRYQVHRWSSLGERNDGKRPASITIDCDMAAILYTSGSTGKPKGVVLSHRNLIVVAERVSQYLRNTSDDTILSALPLSFDAGLSQLTTAFNVGAHVVLMNYLLASDIVRLCDRHKVTGITGVPPFWIQVADQVWPSAATEGLR